MYERAVTTNYLCLHPEEAKEFKAFERIADYKLMRSVLASGGENVFSKEQATKIEREYAAVKEQFVVTNCKKCQTTRINHSWNKKDLVSMARESDGLWLLLPYAYLQPTRQLHSTMNSIFSRLDREVSLKGGGLMFDLVLRVAHIILLNVLNIQKECFHITELEPLLETCKEDASAIYKEG
jgi:hypothetical protein